MTELDITTACPHAHEDAAYVLGALSPEERVAFERHLPTCRDCAQAVRELAGIPGLLARVPVEILDPGQLPHPVPDTLLPGLVRRARRTQRRRTWVTAGLVGVAAAATVAAVGFATVGADDSPPSAAPTPEPTVTATSTAPSAAPSTAPPEAMRPVGNVPISGWVSLTQVSWGTRLDLTCRYAEQDSDYADPRWSTYTMLVHTADGTVEQVASWKALPGRTVQVTGASSADRDDIVSVEVQTSTGQQVLVLS
ncbi:anti-sigma factor family protein [Nocardioides dilutus]